MVRKPLVIGLVMVILLGSLGMYFFVSYSGGMIRLQEELADLEKDRASLNELLSEKESELEELYNHIGQLESKKQELEEIIQNLTHGLEADDGVEVFFIYHSPVAEYSRWIGNANETIRVMVNCIEDLDIVDALIEAVMRDVDVKVLFDETYTAQAYTEGLFNWLLNWGVDIRESGVIGINHGALIVDSKFVIVGTYNWGHGPIQGGTSVIVLKADRPVQLFIDEFEKNWLETTSLLPPPMEPWPELENGTIVISEIESNPVGRYSDSEWIEIYNPWDFAIDISGYRLHLLKPDSNITLAPGTYIDPRQYLVIYLPMESLYDSQGTVDLYNSEGEKIDSMMYRDFGDDDATTQLCSYWNYDYASHTRGRPYRPGLGTG